MTKSAASLSQVTVTNAVPVSPSTRCCGVEKLQDNTSGRLTPSIYNWRCADFTYPRFIIEPPALDTHSFRRPAFLRFLNLKQYIEFYQLLVDDEYKLQSNMDSPESLVKGITAVGQPLSQLYHH